VVVHRAAASDKHAMKAAHSAGMAIGAAIMAIHAGQAAEREAVSGNARLKSTAPDPLGAVPAASPRIKVGMN
jgi:hypothetical protein